MPWLIDSVRIFTQDLKDDDDQIIARLNPLAGGTTLHLFGYDDEITHVSAYIVGLVDKAAIKAMAKDAATHSLTTPYGGWGDFTVKHASFQLTPMICQTLRTDLPEDSPVFRVELELYRDE